MRRGQGGDPELVLAETDEALRTQAWDAIPGAAQRIAYCRCALGLLLDDLDLALTEADRVVGLARQHARPRSRRSAWRCAARC